MALGVAPELDLLLDPCAVLLAGRTGLLRRPRRWPGWGVSGLKKPLSRPSEPVATPGGIYPAGPLRRPPLVAADRLAIQRLSGARSLAGCAPCAAAFPR